MENKEKIRALFQKWKKERTDENFENFYNASKNENDDNSDTTTDDSNVLVLYFSMSGNTEAVANIIHDEVGGDIIKLETVQAYPEDYDELVDYAQQEQQ